MGHYILGNSQKDIIIRMMNDMSLYHVFMFVYILWTIFMILNFTLLINQQLCHGVRGQNCIPSMLSQTFDHNILGPHLSNIRFTCFYINKVEFKLFPGKYQPFPVLFVYFSRHQSTFFKAAFLGNNLKNVQFSAPF